MHKKLEVMEHLIDKDTLVAEIEDLEDRYKKCPTRNSYEEGLKDGRLIGYKDALHKIDTLEVKEIEEEPISEDLEQAIDTYLATYFGGEKEKQDWPFLKKMAIHFANWQKKQFEKNRLAACDRQTEEEAEIESDFIMSIIENEHRQPTFDDAIKYGMRLQKENMMLKAVDGEVGYWNQRGLSVLMSLPSEFEENDKCKIILIKED